MKGKYSQWSSKMLLKSLVSEPHTRHHCPLAQPHAGHGLKSPNEPSTLEAGGRVEAHPPIPFHILKRRLNNLSPNLITMNQARWLR
jgi:hypothetical protein